MLRGSNDAALVCKGVKEDVVPFYQIWQELVDPRTLDVYRYRVLTSLSALIELKSVLKKTLSGLFDTDANIAACREELLHILNHDPVLEKYYKSLLNRLRFHLGKNTSKPEDKNKLLQQISYAIKKIGPQYFDFALCDLKKSIAERNINGMEQNANIVVSQAISMGWSVQALSGLLRYFISDRSFEDQWNDFRRELISSKLPQHCVLINVPFRNQGKTERQKTIEVLNSLGLVIKNYAELVKEFNGIEDIKGLLKAEKQYFRIYVEAKDIYSASHLAIRKISEQLNFASFYNLVDAWDLKSVVIVAINMQNQYHRAFTAQMLYATHDYIDSSGRIFEDTCQIFENRDNYTIREKLQGSFGYTNISRASLFQEEKYMNLWVALESLARTSMYSNIISNIKETVPAAICLRYIYRIVRNFVEDCKRCNVTLDFSTCLVDMEQTSKQKMVREMITVFKNDALYIELQEKCRVNALLSKRVEDVRKLMTDLSYAKRKIENHYRHIYWQIQRLYRIRNEIAHAALREQASLIVYLEHLYHYLSTYISEIVTCLSEKKLETMEEALCLIKDNYDVFMALSDESDCDLLENNVLETGIIDLISEPCFVHQYNIRPNL